MPGFDVREFIPPEVFPAIGVSAWRPSGLVRRFVKDFGYGGSVGDPRHARIVETEEQAAAVRARGGFVVHLNHPVRGLILEVHGEDLVIPDHSDGSRLQFAICRGLYQKMVHKLIKEHGKSEKGPGSLI